MPIIKSIFWLCVAFVVIGPRIDYQGSVSSISNQAVDAGQQLLREQTNVRTCDTIECFGTRMAVSAGANAVGDFLEHSPLRNGTAAQTNLSLSSPALVVPQPRARLDRSG